MAKDTKNVSPIAASALDIVRDMSTIAGNKKDTAEAQYNVLKRIAGNVKRGLFTSTTRVDASGTLLNDPKADGAMTVASFYVSQAALHVEKAAQKIYASEWHAIAKGASHRTTLVDDFEAVFGANRIYDKACADTPGAVDQKYKVALRIARAVAKIDADVPLIVDDEPGDIIKAALPRPTSDPRTPDEIAKAIHTAIVNAVKGTEKKPSDPRLQTKVWQDALKAVTAAYHTMENPTAQKAAKVISDKKPEVRAALEKDILNSMTPAALRALAEKKQNEKEAATLARKARGKKAA